MKIDLKTIIAVMVTVVILAGGYFYLQRTAQERAYKAEIKKLQLIQEHQALEIEVAKQKIEFAAIKRGTNRNSPVINLTPKPEKKEQNVD